jgi:hypothetical protein
MRESSRDFHSFMHLSRVVKAVTSNLCEYLLIHIDMTLLVHVSDVAIRLYIQFISRCDVWDWDLVFLRPPPLLHRQLPVRPKQRSDWKMDERYVPIKSNFSSQFMLTRWQKSWKGIKKRGNIIFRFSKISSVKKAEWGKIKFLYFFISILHVPKSQNRAKEERISFLLFSFTLVLFCYLFL